MNISELCYELYKINWMKRISPERQMNALKDYYEGLVDAGDEYTFDDYIEEFGYDSELYACYDEFIDYEYQDSDYIENLLDNKELFEEYKRDVEG